MTATTTNRTCYQGVAAPYDVARAPLSVRTVALSLLVPAKARAGLSVAPLALDT